MKLKTKIQHKFNIESDSLDDFDFSFNLPKKNLKPQIIKITEIKKKHIKNKQDASTRLF